MSTTNTNCDSCSFCYSCHYCHFCDYCRFCYYCNYCKNLKMTEFNIFCASYVLNSDTSFQQPRYRAFNKVVGEERYSELVKLIKDDILKDFKLDARNLWTEEWKKVTPQQWKRLAEIPEYDPLVVEMITGFKPVVDDKVDVTVEGKTTRISRESAIALGLLKD